MSSEQFAHRWLKQQGLNVVGLTPLHGSVNDVLLVETLNRQAPLRSVLRVTKTGLPFRFCSSAPDAGQAIGKHQAARLLDRARLRGYQDCPAVSIHRDLHPGNWVHDGERWWLVDWDLAKQDLAIWNFASLITEHFGTFEQARLLASHIAPVDLGWHCQCTALLAWNWHSQHGLAPEVLTAKQQQYQYWFLPGR